ncbi:MAG: hypothetical protein OSJ62_02460 [Lachnospiraceae bacterium]|nr:hypothetical protein [Lachnospiraceae bacterium]
MWKNKFFILCILCTLLLWYSTEIRQQYVAWFDGKVSVCWEDSGVSPRQISQILYWQKKDPIMLPPLTLWNSFSNQIVYGDIYPTPAKGEILEYYGEISSLLPCQFRYGDWPKDTQGCVIDEGIAYSLWGSSDVLGRSLQWNKNTWYVQGIITGTNHLVLFPTKETNPSLFPNLWLDLSKNQENCLLTEQILQAYQLPMGIVTDFGLFVCLAKIITSFPILLLWVGMVLCIITRLWHLRHTKFLLFLSVPFLVLGIGVLSWVAELSWTIPERFLPTKWSDSSFFYKLGEQIQSGISTISNAPSAVWKKLFWQHFFQCSISAVLTTFFLWLTVKNLPLPAPKSIFGFSLIWWTGLLGMIWQNRSSMFANPSLSLWLFPTVWITLKWLLSFHAKWLTPKTFSKKEIKT